MKKALISAEGPTTWSVSPAERTKSPLGMMTCPSCSTAQMRMLEECLSRSLTRRSPHSGDSGARVNSTISARPFAKDSTFAAEGKRSMREISAAAACSGLSTSERPSSSLRNTICRKYSIVRTRATVFFTPSFLPVRQQSMFTESSLVTAMSRSASSTPASVRTL